MYVFEPRDGLDEVQYSGYVPPVLWLRTSDHA